MYLNEPRNDQDGKLVNVSVFFGCHGDSSLFQKQNMVGIFISTAICNSKLVIPETFHFTSFFSLFIYLFYNY